MSTEPLDALIAAASKSINYRIENKESTKKPSKKKQRIDSIEKENDTENQVETPITADLDNDNDSGKI